MPARGAPLLAFCFWNWNKNVIVLLSFMHKLICITAALLGFSLLSLGQTTSSGSAGTSRDDSQAQAPGKAKPQSSDTGIRDDEIRNALIEYFKTKSPSGTQPSITLQVLDSKGEEALTAWLNEQVKSKPSLWLTFLQNGGQAILGGLLGGVIGLLAQQLAAKNQLRQEEQRSQNDLDRERQIEELRANIDVTREIMKLRMKRLESFHAPLRALFQQSKGVTDRLMRHVYHLHDKNPTDWGDTRPYEFMNDEVAIQNHPPGSRQRNVNSPDERLHVYHNGRWIKFRILDFMHLLTKDTYCKELVGKIIEIGKCKTKIISEYGGFSASGEQPPAIFGEYLAHFVVLDVCYNNPPTLAYDPETQEVGYYPRHLDEVIEEGYQAARNEVAEYEKLCNSIMKRLAEG